MRPLCSSVKMQEILSPFPWGKVVVYIDYILILGNTFEEHLDLVGKVLVVMVAS